MLAVHRGSGSSSLYPLTFNISTDSEGTLSIVEGCASTRLPSEDLPENIPFPRQYSVNGTTVLIRFSEVPENAL